MARKRSTPTADNLSDAGTSSVANRQAAEAERQATASEARAQLIAETRASKKATAKRLENKPADTRGL
jgi:hypothetical protein